MSKRSDGTPSKPPPRPEEYEERLLACERAMVLAVSDREAAQLMVRQFGVVLRTALDWTLVVRKRWAARATDTLGSDAKLTLEEHRARLRMLYSIAMGQALPGDQAPRDPDAETEPPARDLKVALQAADRLAQLDGLLTSAGPPPMVMNRWKEQDTGADSVTSAIVAGFAQLQQIVQDKGMGVLAEGPAMPSADELNPRAALKRKDAELAALREELARARSEAE